MTKVLLLLVGTVCAANMNGKYSIANPVGSYDDDLTQVPLFSLFPLSPPSPLVFLFFLSQQVNATPYKSNQNEKYKGGQERVFRLLFAQDRDAIWHCLLEECRWR